MCLAEVSGLVDISGNDKQVLHRYVQIRVLEVLGGPTSQTFTADEMASVKSDFYDMGLERHMATTNQSTQDTELDNFSQAVNEADHGQNHLHLILQAHTKRTKHTTADNEFLMGIFKMECEALTSIKRDKIAADVRKEEIQGNVDIERAKTEAAKARADAQIQLSRDRVRLAELRAESKNHGHSDAAKRKRPATLEEFARPPYRNNLSLSLAVWDARPAGHPETMEEVFRSVGTWVVDQKVKASIRRTDAFPGVPCVYVRVDATQYAEQFWSQSSAAKETIPNPPLPVADGGYPDLVAFLAPHFAPHNPNDKAERTALTTHLHNEFLKPLCERGWEVLFELPVHTQRILTHIDLQRDPVAPRLQRWANAGCTGPAPVEYPYDAEDQRPEEVIPPELHALPATLDVAAVLIDKGLGVFCRNPRYAEAYQRSQRMNTEAVPPARSPRHAEMVRQWQRQCKAAAYLPYKTIVRTLGWTTTLQDHALIKVITHALLHPMPMEEWYDRTTSLHGWRPERCLEAMRLASVYVAHLRRGGADLRFATNDVKQCLSVDVNESLR